MKKIAILYGTLSGNTHAIAKYMEDLTGVDKVSLYDINDIQASVLDKYENIIMGIPTWSFGQLHKAWKIFKEEMKSVDLNHKKIALFGLGDQKNYDENFADGLREVYDILIAKGANIIGEWPADDYHFTQSKALLDNGNFVGLVLDEDTQSLKTKERIEKWHNQIMNHFK